MIGCYHVDQSETKKQNIPHLETGNKVYVDTKISRAIRLGYLLLQLMGIKRK